MSDAVLILNPGASPFFNTKGAHVRCEQGRITAIGSHLAPQANEQCIDAQGGALLPALHDRHIHLLATAAARASFDCAQQTADTLVERLQRYASRIQRTQQGRLDQHVVPPWLRAVNYNEAFLGEISRTQLDQWLPNQPMRVQHSTGSMWVLNSLALRLLNLHALNDERLERDSRNQLTGRLFRADDLLRERLQEYGFSTSPNLTDLSQELASFGITDVTDTSATNGAAEYELLRHKQQRGELLQRVRLMGRADLPKRSEPLIQTGELKILLDEATLPDLDELVAKVALAHSGNRGVAFHCVTRIELAVVISVLSTTGVYRDRIEHGSIIPTNTIDQLRSLDVQIVTQPGLIYSRGDRYLQDLETIELEQLYRVASLLNNGIRVVGSSDAPYGPLNPWLTMQCAVDRRTANGATIGLTEAITPTQALGLFCPNSTIKQGQVADLCLLAEPWSSATQQLAQTTVTHTFRAGEMIHHQA